MFLLIIIFPLQYVVSCCLGERLLGEAALGLRRKYVLALRKFNEVLTFIVEGWVKQSRKKTAS